MALQPSLGVFMLQLIAAPSHTEFADDLAEMFRLRYRVFKKRLDWDVRVEDGMEVDDFDALHPAYLLQRDRDNRVCAFLGSDKEFAKACKGPVKLDSK
jgi:N-acyl-L-homoserine lactone synthetase